MSKKQKLITDSNSYKTLRKIENAIELLGQACEESNCWEVESRLDGLIDELERVRSYAGMAVISEYREERGL